MNYAKHYELLISKHGSVEKPEFIVERHHIIPKCLGGSNDISNLIYLTPEAHYVAHQLLVKIYPKNRDIIYGAFIMSSGSYLHNRVSNKLYSWLKKRAYGSMRGENHPMFGKTHNESTKKLMSKAKSNYFGENNSFYGKKHSDETKIKMSEAGKKRTGSNNPMYGKTHSPDVIAKILATRKANKERKLT
jgi:hypothetical protein